MSEKSDRQFFNHFAVVIILLHGIMVALFVLARMVGNRTQEHFVRSDQEMQRAVEERLKPFARVAVAGADNEGLEIIDERKPGSGPVQQAVLELSGKETYDTACMVCHATGVTGAPRFGDTTAWRTRLAKGRKTLYDHALKGYQGQQGVMPPKGGRPDLSDESVTKAVDYMLSEAG